MVGKTAVYKAEVVIAMLLVAVIGLSVFRVSSTGFVPANVQREPLGIVIDHSQIYHVRFSESTALQSFGISGTVEGDGTAYVFLDNKDGTRLLVYTNVRQLSNLENARLITGLATASIERGRTTSDQIPLSPDEEIISGPFVNECYESCTTPPAFSRDSYELVFVVQPGVRLELSEIVYITE